MSNIIEIVLIVDCSKLMSGQEFETVSRINAILDNYSKSECAYITTVVFNEIAYMLHDRLKVDLVKPLTISDIRANGKALLYDTVAVVINHIRNVHHYIRKEDIPDKTIFYVFSIGEDNISTKYTKEEIQKMAYERKIKDGWQFNFENINRNISSIDDIHKTAQYNTISDDFEILKKMLSKNRFT